MTQVGEISVGASIDTAQFRKQSKEIESEAKKTGDAVGAGLNDGTQKGTNRATEAVSKFGKFLGTAVVAGAAVAAAAVTAIGVSAVKSYANLEQSLGGAEVVFGEFSDSVKKEAKESSKFMGTTMGQYLDTANKMGSLFQGSGLSVKKSMEMSRDAMRRATDVATAMGISNEMALESIAGAAKGNFTMMDNLGVKMTATSIAAYALSKGITKSFDSMTESEKVGLAMQQFMEVTAKYAGNYSKENDTLSGSFQTLKGTWGNFLAGVEGSGKTVADAAGQMAKVLGRELPNIFDSLIQNAKGMYSQLRESSPEFKHYSDIAQDTFKIVSDVIKNTVNTVKTLVPAIVGVESAFLAYKAVIIGLNTIQRIQATYATLTATSYVLLNGSLFAVRGATIAQTVAQYALNTAMRLNPVGLVVGGLALLVGALFATTQSSANAQTATERLKSAREMAKVATDNLKLAEDNLSGAQLGAEGAALRAEQAQRNYTKAVQDYGPDSLEARTALYDVKVATQNVADANKDVEDKTKLALEAQQEIVKAKDEIIKANQQIANSVSGVSGQLQNVARDAQNAKTEIQKVQSVGGTVSASTQLKAAGMPSLNFPHKASGGPVDANKPYFVGDNKDGSLNSTSELFVPRTSGSIMNSSDLQKALGNSSNGGGSIENNIGTINIADKLTADYFLRKLNGNQEIVSNGLTPAQKYA